MQNHSQSTGKKIHHFQEQLSCERTESSARTLNSFKLILNTIKKVWLFFLPCHPWLIFSCYGVLFLFALSYIPNIPTVFNLLETRGISAFHTYFIGFIYSVIAGTISSIYVFFKLKELRKDSQKKLFIFSAINFLFLTIFTTTNFFFLCKYFWYLLTMIRVYNIV